MKNTQLDIYSLKMAKQFLFLIVQLSLSLVLVLAQNQSGFISIDCGYLDKDKPSYKDGKTGIDYTSDAEFIDSGVSHSISPESKANNSFDQQFWNVRSFPDGARNCYSFNRTSGDSSMQYLIRVRFMYGNYDGLNSPPKFDIHLGTIKWDTVEFENQYSIVTKEIIYSPVLYYTHVCLLNTGNGIPFISVLEIRPIHGYEKDKKSMELIARFDLGSQDGKAIRFPDDGYDRIWTPYISPDIKNMSTTHTINDTGFLYGPQIPPAPPSTVMKTAAMPANADDNLTVPFAAKYNGSTIYAVFYIAELQNLPKNQKRQLDFYGGKYFSSSGLSPSYLYGYFSIEQGTAIVPQVWISTPNGSSVPPLLNAVEIFALKSVSLSETDRLDTEAIMKIKKTYEIKKNWQGDPCYPPPYAWEGINCTDEGSGLFKITSLNLSSSGLTKSIVFDIIINLKSLETLDLSNNRLIGEVPSVLSQMQSLKFLNIEDNELSGTIPAELIDRSKDGSLRLRYGGNPNLCMEGSCRKRNRNKVAISLVASLAGAFVLAAAATITFCILKRRQLGEMPPKKSAYTQRPTRVKKPPTRFIAEDEAERTSQPPGGKGGRVRTQRRQARQTEGAIHNEEPVNLGAELRRLHQTIDTLVELITNQRRDEASPHVETEQHQRGPQPFGRAEVSLDAYMRLNPPTFSGDSLDEDPQEFLDRAKRALRVLQCNDVRAVDIVTYTLQGTAAHWHEALLEERANVGMPPPIWEEFTEAFLARFFPSNRREFLVDQFVKLKQTLGMSVAEYAAQFTRLSRYAPHEVTPEERMVRRFVRGLRDPMRSILYREIGRMSFSKVMDNAIGIENMQEEERARRGTGKKSKIKGQYSGSSYFGGSKGQIGRCYVPTGGLISSGPTPVSISGTRSVSRSHVSASQSNIQWWGQSGHQQPHCKTCGKYHIGACRVGQISGAGFGCEQFVHYLRDCPHLAGGSSQYSTQSSMPTPSFSTMSLGSTVEFSGRGLGSKGNRGTRGQDRTSRGQPRISAMTYQDAQASNTGVAVGATPSMRPFLPNIKKRLGSKKQQFTYAEIIVITNNFERVLGKGAFGTVYHGYVDNTQVAVKMLSPSTQGYKQFEAEANLLTRVHHKCLTGLLGYCYQGTNVALIYEYMENGDLSEYLSEKSEKFLDWKQRIQIAVDAAEGLEYLHNGCKPPIVHRDIKPRNILVNDKLRGKIGDFGLSKIFPNEGDTHVFTGIAGTPGYVDPQYCVTNRLNEKSDVYSFGVVLLELITGQPAITKTEGKTHITQLVGSMLLEREISDIMDPRLQGTFDANSAKKALDTAMACVAPTSTNRPTMSEVVMELKQCLALQMAQESDSVVGYTPNNLTEPSSPWSTSNRLIDVSFGSFSGESSLLR